MSRIILGGGINDTANRKLLADGSEWERIFWHDVSTTSTWFASSTEAKDCNQSNRFSKLGTLDKYRYNGKYEFMLIYPKYSTTKYNRWIQYADPLTTTSDASQTIDSMGYFPVHIDYTSNWKYGMGLSSSSGNALMDCEAGHGNWFGAIGMYSANGYSGGYPAPTESGMSANQKEVELWVRIHNEANIIRNDSNVFYICNKDDFNTFCAKCSSSLDMPYVGETVVLMTDIWTSGANEHKNFAPLSRFYGVFDGNGHTIYMSYIDNEEDDEDVGFLKRNAGTIKNLSIVNMYINVTKQGGIICADNSFGTIENCKVIGALSITSGATDVNVGGITGDNAFGKIRKCIVDVTISGSGTTGNIGGAVGTNGSGEICSCRVTGSISGSTTDGSVVGGIVGYGAGTITRCVNYAEISSGYRSGGILGYANPLMSSSCTSCVNLGKGAKYGAIGYNSGRNTW